MESASRGSARKDSPTKDSGTRKSASSRRDRGNRNRERARDREAAHDRHEVPRRSYVGEENTTPFLRQNAPYPDDFDLADLTKYDGTQDLTIHVEDFKVTMCVRRLREPVTTRIFAATLKREALRWLHTLSLKLIHTFTQLAAGLDSESRLAESFFKQPAKSLNEFITRSKKYLEMEQIRLENAPRRDPDRRTPPRDKNQSDGCKQERRGKSSDSKPPSANPELKGKYDKYTPLNVSRSQLWREVASTEMQKIERPRPLRKRASTDQTRFYAFHDSPGHTTDQCYELRDAIEKFFREGKLRQYVINNQGRKRDKRKQGDRQDSLAPERKKDEKRQRPGSEEDEFPEAEFDCNVISGAFGGGGDTTSQRRKNLKEVLSVRDRPKFKEDQDTTNKVERPQLLFTKEDMKDVVPGHQDGLVITGTLVNFRVKKIFIDTGSSADIIIWDAFKRMNLDKEDLKPCKTTLVGFNGELSLPKGLAIRPESTPVAQKKRKRGPDRQVPLDKHVDELLEASFIREIQYSSWLSNMVMVLKPNRKWRVCTDYTNLNKVCSKDAYPMPNIDQLVDNSSGFQLLSFMDAYSGYNQIAMHPDDQ
ncbi:hypothetical protein K1719_002693 [Acacia pycnantha]|nr:hypothetical protein K1719_002693 [Acacia pycnantha]